MFRFIGPVAGLVALAAFGHLWWRSAGHPEWFVGPSFVAIGDAGPALAFDAAMLAAYFTLHSVAASRTLKGKLGLSADAHRRGYLILTLVATIALWLFWAPAPEPVLWDAPTPARELLWLVQLAGIAGFAWTARAFDHREFFGVPRPASNSSETLVFAGPFALCRHPTYFFALLMLFSPYMPAGRALLALSGAIYIVIGSRIEELKLRQAWGEQYEAYRLRTPWLVPSVGSIRRALRDQNE